MKCPPPPRSCRSESVRRPGADQSGAGGLPRNHPARERAEEPDVAPVADRPLQVHQRGHRVSPRVLAESSATAADAHHHR